MRAPVSVVIPTLNAAAGLPGCLTSLFEGLEGGVIRELIVVDGGSNDATIQIAQEVGAKMLSAPPSRGGQLRCGADAANGDWLLFLHADTCLSNGWSDAIQPFLRNDKTVGYFHLRFADGGLAGWFVAGWANLRSRAMGLPYGDQGLLISRAAYDASGGYADIPLMEDVAMARAHRRRLSVLPIVATTSAEKYKKQGWLRRGGRNLWTLFRYLAGANPETLAKNYRKP